MTEAPERILTSQYGKALVHDGMKRFDTDVDYIRKDVSDALVAAAREETLREALDAAREYRYRRGEAVENAILALIDKDKTNG
jgi:hypothetical protein